MSFGLRCHMNGFASSFQCEVQTSMASVSAATESKLPSRSRRFVSCANQPSTRFSHDELVGVKCEPDQGRTIAVCHTTSRVDDSEICS